MEPKLKAFAVVSVNEAKSNPYPYVYVNEDGSVRELHASERTELETPFSPLDGGRPYVKNSYDQKNAMKSLAGFCHRSKIAKNIRVLPAPQEDPVITARKQQAAKMIQYAKERGFNYVENADGTVTIKRPKPQEK